MGGGSLGTLYVLSLFKFGNFDRTLEGRPSKKGCSFKENGYVQKNSLRTPNCENWYVQLQVNQPRTRARGGLVAPG
jgi:hypothetical protein